MVKLNCKLRAYTLIELLTVMVVIAILSAVVVFSSVSMTNSAEASRIINNLYTLKMATLAWRKDHMDWIDNDEKIRLNGTGVPDLIQSQPKILEAISKNYIDGDNEFIIKTKIDNGKVVLSNGGEYGIFTFTKTVSNVPKRAWYVGYHLTYAERYNGVREKIRSKVASSNIDVRVGGDQPNKTPTVGDTSEKGVWLKVFGDNDWEPPTKK